MYSTALAEQMRNIKETEKGVTDMCREMEKIYEEGIEQGIAQGISQGIAQGIERGIADGRSQGIEQMVRNALRKRPAGEIAEMLDLPLEQVLDIERQAAARQ